ncbi:MAG TPA: transcriptional regulator [Mycobacteriales bacterium]|nr:transcriptional regulator [Mycobacteriales bacterium]
MKRILLSPKWLVGHLFVMAIVLGMLRLGLWQWHRAESGNGGIQNYAYAFQWPCFAVFGIVLWVKTIRIELDDSDEKASPLRNSRFAAKPLPEPAIVKGPGVRIGIATLAIEPDEDDVEVTAYNAYLARLNARAKGA